MDVVLAHPEGYNVMPEIEEVAAENARKSGGSYTRVNSMAEASRMPNSTRRAGHVCRMEERHSVGDGKFDELKDLEMCCFLNNSNFNDCKCTEELMATTNGGKALYMHCLPADISGVSCKEGEVAASVFERYRVPLYKEASYKPYIIAAMIFLAKFRNPADKLSELVEAAQKRII